MRTSWDGVTGWHWRFGAGGVPSHRVTLSRDRATIVVLLLLALVVVEILGKGRDHVGWVYLALAMMEAPTRLCPMLVALVAAKRWKAAVGCLAMSTALLVPRLRS